LTFIRVEIVAGLLKPLLKVKGELLKVEFNVLQGWANADDNAAIVIKKMVKKSGI